MGRDWPVDVEALGRLACGSVVWAGASGLRATVIAKASFAMRAGAAVELVDPSPVAKKDVHRDGSPWSSIVAADDLAPRLSGVGVVLTGHAHATGAGVTAHAVRLALSRGKVLLDKTLHVFGDRSLAEPGQPKPFERVPLDFEHAYGGPGFGANPVGTGAAAGAAPPNVVAPSDPRKPASFAPIPRMWEVRRGLLDAAQRKAVADATPHLGDDFPWGYFHAAPDDQRLDGLVGDEWLLLEGMHPSLPRIETRLPGGRAVARVFGVGSQPIDVALRLDSLIIDADRQELSLVWRGAVGLAAAAPSRVKALVALELPGAAPTVWPAAIGALPDAASDAEPEASDAPDFNRTVGLTLEEAAAAAHRPAAPFTAEPPAPQRDPFAGTVVVHPGDARASASLPFGPSAPTGPRQPSPMLPGAPWAPAGGKHAPDVPRRDDLGPFDHTMDTRDVAPPSLGPAAVEPDARAASTAPAVPVSHFFHKAARPEEAGGAPPPPDGPRPPARDSEVARIYADVPFTAATIAWQIKPPVDALIVVVKGTFALVPGAPAALLEESDLPLGDVHVDDDPMKSLISASDFAVLKPKADVLVHAHAHAPGGKARAMQVTLRFGRGDRGFERTLHVFGDRAWEKSVITLAPTDPAEFTTLPLTWERAFGGPAYDKNPAGVGHRAAAGADGTARLPNVEITSDRVTGPSDAPPPAGFGPIPPQWRERWSKLGTYDASWFKTRWPYWAKDFDWTFYQAAPASQQLPYLAGDEAFELVGMTAGRPALTGTLPGLRARAFVQRTPEADGGFAPVPLVLDTVTFDPEGMRVHLVWRGHLDVSDDDAPEVQHVFVTAEPHAGPALSLAEARARYLAVATPAPTPPEAPPATPAPPQDDALRAAEKAREAKLADVAPPEPGGGEPPEAPGPSLDEIAASMKRRGANDAEIEELLDVLRPRVVPAAAPPPSPRQRAVELLASGAPFDGLAFDGADLADLDFSGRSLAGASFVGANLSRARFAGASLVEARLERADLTLAVLDEADLRGADLTRATLDEASFSRANAAGARLEGARGERVAFTDLAGKSADFRGADLPRARFDGADLTAATFFSARTREARFTGATMDEVRFYDVDATGSVLDGVKAKGGRFERANLTSASFKGASVPGAVFERCRLERANFGGVDATGASFLRAAAAKASFTAATLVDARLTRARLAGASFLGANLLGAKLDKADLTRADFRRSNLHGAGLWRAKMEGADFAEAIITKSTLVARRPP